MRVAKQTYLASKRDGALWHIAIDQLHASRPDLLVLLAPAGSCVYGHNFCCHIIIDIVDSLAHQACIAGKLFVFCYFRHFCCRCCYCCILLLCPFALQADAKRFTEQLASGW